jgi:hypothetical protein
MLIGLQEVALPSLFAKRAWKSERLAARAFGLAACAAAAAAAAAATVALLQLAQTALS